MDNELRNKLLHLLLGKGAHMTFEEAVADFPVSDINTFPTNVPYTFWHLLEHMRLSQHDILDYILNKNYNEPEWPSSFWPEEDAKTDESGWTNTIQSFLSDRERLEKIVSSRETELFTSVPSYRGHTIFRQILLVGDHNAYHTGEFGILRQVVGNWAMIKKE